MPATGLSAELGWREEMQIRVLASVLVAFAVAVGAPAGTAAGDPAGKRSARALAKLRLKSFERCGELVAYARRYAPRVEPYYSPGGPVPVDTITAPPPPSTGGGEGTATDTQTPQPAPGTTTEGRDSSTTNVQEAGVDEPDAVKTDGDTIYRDRERQPARGRRPVAAAPADRDARDRRHGPAAARERPQAARDRHEVRRPDAAGRGDRRGRRGGPGHRAGPVLLLPPDHRADRGRHQRPGGDEDDPHGDRRGQLRLRPADRRHGSRGGEQPARRARAGRRGQRGAADRGLGPEVLGHRPPQRQGPAAQHRELRGGAAAARPSPGST